MRPERSEARRLRRRGKSYNEISRLLGVPKSTLSGWFRDLRLSRAERKHLMTRVQRHWAESIIRYNKWRAQEARQRTARTVSLAATEVGNLNGRELRLIGTALYWAEGAKFNRWELRFSNTDPSMVRLMMRFFREECQVPPKKFSAKIHLHPHISEKRSKTFWSQVTRISPQQFQKSQRAVSRSSNGRRPVRRLPYGTLHVAVRDVSIRNRVMGWIAGLGQSLNGSGSH